jgi:glycosyltransferase involved in cell wall biosynthesis
MEYPFVSVVAGIRNEEKFIEECIEALLKMH